MGHRQAVRHQTLTLTFPGFESLCPSQKKDQVTCDLVFFQRCVPQAERDVPLGRDVCFASDVRFAREEAEHITSLCDEVAIHHYGEAIISLRQRRNITPKTPATISRKKLAISTILCYTNPRKAVRECAFLNLKLL